VATEKTGADFRRGRYETKHATVPASLVPAPLSADDYVEVRARMITEWCAPLADLNVPFRVVLMVGDPAVVIMQTAKTEHADLVVVGRRGRGGVAELVLGGTTYAVVHHLDRPLLIVP
jgi:nucleotide-binding universal stress UspA family protein